MEQLTAVLFSGGLDSAVLVASAAREGIVQPLYVSVGLAWEADERVAAGRFLDALPDRARVLPMVPLRVDMTDVYPPTHWAVRGEAPAFDSPDEDVYLDGRNVVLIAKASVYMARHGIARLQLGPLAGNPFPDATAAFFGAFGDALSIGLAHRMAIEAPLSAMHKADVIRLGVEIGAPLELTLSCMQPVGGLHCGRCSKCRERRDAFSEACLVDPVRYASTPPR
jgi:7-cyano-7-deazaguanine synthase